MKKIWTGLFIIGLSLACLIVCAGSIAKEYGLVAILPIGMSQVSSCNWEESVKPSPVSHPLPPVSPPEMPAGKILYYSRFN